MFSLAFYYTKAEYGTRIASWFGFAAVAGAFGGLLAYGIQHVNISIANWRLLFIVEVGLLAFFIRVRMKVQQGVPTVLFGVLCLFLLPGRPESTKFLTHAERKLAVERMNRGTSGDIGATVNRGTRLQPLLRVFNRLIWTRTCGCCRFRLEGESFPAMAACTADLVFRSMLLVSHVLG